MLGTPPACRDTASVSESEENESECNQTKKRRKRLSPADEAEDIRNFNPNDPALSEYDSEVALAIFELGLKYASPRVLMDIMEPYPQLTAEHVKSHLQKSRLNLTRSKEEFMRYYHRHLGPEVAGWLNQIRHEAINPTALMEAPSVPLKPLLHNVAIEAELLQTQLLERNLQIQRLLHQTIEEQHEIQQELLYADSTGFVQSSADWPTAEHTLECLSTSARVLGIIPAQQQDVSGAPSEPLQKSSQGLEISDALLHAAAVYDDSISAKSS